MDESLLTISVIIPVYNETERLRTCLSALAEQTYPRDRFEVIVVDNGSRESPQAIVDRYPFARLAVELTPGSYAARNYGLKLATGEILAFTDSDCIPSPDWLSAGVAAIEAIGKMAVIGGRINVFAADVNQPNAVELYDIAIAFDQELSIRKSGYAVTANLLAPRAAFDRVGPFNQQLLSGGDGEWCHRAADAGIPTVYCHEAVIDHPARASMAELIRKARRVIGGRHQRNRRSILSLDFWRAAARFVFPDLKQFTRGRRKLLTRGYSRWSAVKLAAVVTLLHYIKIAEYVWVRLGGEVERR